MHLNDWQKWRDRYWIDGAGQAIREIEYQRGGKTLRRSVNDHDRRLPTVGTKRQEWVFLKAVFRFAVDQKWLEDSAVPLRTFRNTKASATGKRPAFTLVEWNRLQKKADDWVNQRKLSGDNRRTRQLCWWFAVLCRAFALRAAEGYELRWRHVLDDVDHHGNPVVILAVPAVKNEKHERSVEPIFSFAPAIRELLRGKLPALYRAEYGREPEPDQPVFMHKDGLPIRSFFRGFESLLQFACLLHDPHGNRFSLTSLRHSAITDEIENTDLNVGVIAVWAGTSIPMIDRHYNQALANRSV